MRYQSLKILHSDWPRVFLHLTWELDFSQTCGFNKIINVIMVHDLNLKNLHINGLFLFCKIQCTQCFWVFFGHYSQNEIFSQKSGSVSFLPLKHPNFMRSFTKILWAVSEKTRLSTNILTREQFRRSQRPVVGHCPASWFFFEILFCSENAKKGL